MHFLTTIYLIINRVQVNYSRNKTLKSLFVFTLGIQRVFEQSIHK